MANLLLFSQHQIIVIKCKFIFFSKNENVIINKKSRGNKGAFIRFKSNNDGTGINHSATEYVKFDAVPHPHVPSMAYSSGMSG